MTIRGADYDFAFVAFDAGVTAANPYAAVKTHIPVFDDPPFVVSIGKAAVEMCKAAMDVLPETVGALVVTNPENMHPLEGAKVLAGSHPVPDEKSIDAGLAIIKAIEGLPANCPILCLISGGGSALVAVPVNGVSLQDKATLNHLLLGSGADIVQMNLIRQQVSRLKGGGLLRLAGDRPVTGLILSDVIGDDLRAIASGPTVAPIGDRVAALKTCNELEIFDKIPKSIRDHLSSSAYETIPKQATNILVGSNQISLQAMRLPSGKGNVVPTPICGDAKDAAKKIAELGRGIHFLGGETTVVLTGTGKGGRNQDLALRVALIAEDEGWDDPWFYLQAGTDGRDGPTDAAGGIVDHTTLAKIRAAGIDPRAALQNNDAYTALKAGQGLLITGGTATNVADLGVLIRR